MTAHNRSSNAVARNARATNDLDALWAMVAGKGLRPSREATLLLIGELRSARRVIIAADRYDEAFNRISNYPQLHEALMGLREALDSYKAGEL